jgi:hypothetical protein
MFFIFEYPPPKNKMISLFLDNQNPNLFIYLFVVFGDPPPNFYFYFKKKNWFFERAFDYKKSSSSLFVWGTLKTNVPSTCMVSFCLSGRTGTEETR